MIINMYLLREESKLAFSLKDCRGELFVLFLGKATCKGHGNNETWSVLKEPTAWFGE